MKKNEVAKAIAERLGLPKVECEAVIEEFGEVVKEALARNEKVTIRGFISFEVSEMRERNGYNPVSGKMEIFDSVKKVVCRIGKPIKDAVNMR